MRSLPPLDYNGAEVWPGDFVRCKVSHYLHYKPGRAYMVLAVNHKCIKLPLPKIGDDERECWLKAVNFEKVRDLTASDIVADEKAPRRYFWHGLTYSLDRPEGPSVDDPQNQMERKNPMLHIAIHLPPDWESLNQIGYIAQQLNSGRGPGQNLMADISIQQLTERVRQRIIANPAEQWLILSATTLAKMSVPPVQFVAI